MKRLILFIALLPGIALAQPSQGNSTKITDGVQTLDITVANAAKVDGSAVTQPVSAASLPLPSGAATSANQTMANTSLSSIDGKITACNTGAVTVSSSALPTGAATEATLSTLNGKVTTCNTGAVVVSSSALPSGAATAAKQPAFGTAGAASADVLSVQGVASMTPLKIDGSGVTQPVSGTVTADTELPTAATLGDNTTNPSATALGTFAHWFDGSTWDRARGDSTDGLLVNLGSNNDVTVTGTVTAQDGGSSLSVDDNGGSLTVDGSVTVTQSTASNLKAQAQIVDAAGDSCMDGTNDALRVNVVAGGAGDGAIQDGASPSVEASVLDYTNSNPLAVRLTDTNGDYIAAGGGTQYTEDAAAPANPIGTSLNLVRADSLSGLTTTDGDNVAARGTDKGELYVKHVDSIPVTDNGSSLTVDGTVAATQSGTWNVGTVTTVTNVVHVDDNSSTLSVDDGGSSLTVDGTVTAAQATASSLNAEVQGDAAHDAAVSGNPVLVGAFAKATAPTDVSADGDAVRLWADLAGRLQVGDGGSTLSVDDGSGSLTVDGSVTCDAGTNLNTSGLALESGGNLAGLAAIAGTEDAANADAHVGAKMLAVRQDTPANSSNNDGDYEFLRMSAGRLWASAKIDTALPAGTNAIGKLSANSGVDIGDVTIDNASGASAVNIQDGGNSITIDGTVTASNTAGDIAHDAGDSGNPVKVGYKAANALPTAVANADRANGISDLWGRQLVSHIDPAMQSRKSFNATTQQTGSDVWSPASGKKIAITSVVISSYATTACRLILWVGANADTTFSEGTDDVIVKASFAPSSTTKPGLVFTPAVPIFTGTADHELHITTDAGCSIDLSIAGYEF